MTAADALLTASLVERIGTILAGHGPEIQGAVLADLTSMWLAGHVAGDDDDDTARYRKTAFRLWCKTVLALMPVNEKILFERLRQRSH